MTGEKAISDGKSDKYKIAIAYCDHYKLVRDVHLKSAILIRYKTNAVDIIAFLGFILFVTIIWVSFPVLQFKTEL